MAKSLVGGGQLLLFWVQLRLLRLSVDDARTAADSAREGAAAARDSADTAKLSMIAGKRAYVHHAGFRWLSHLHSAHNRFFWRLRPKWINTGDTPTRGLRVYVKYELLDGPLPDDFPFSPDPATERPPAMISPKGVIESAHYDIWGDDLIAISQQKEYVYAWGLATYRDVFPGTSEHVTKFCVFIQTISGDPLIGFDKDTNPLDIILRVYHRHNCADDDCGEAG